MTGNNATLCRKYTRAGRAYILEPFTTLKKVSCILYVKLTDVDLLEDIQRGFAFDTPANSRIFPVLFACNEDELLCSCASPSPCCCCPMVGIHPSSLNKLNASFQDKEISFSISVYCPVKEKRKTNLAMEVGNAALALLIFVLFKRVETQELSRILFYIPFVSKGINLPPLGSDVPCILGVSLSDMDLLELLQQFIPPPSPDHPFHDILPLPLFLLLVRSLLCFIHNEDLEVFILL
uniref:Uncharacterized protein n=1 Tax=Solanum lycopersicum TaxID=4081 RepID=A0A3Q7F857_SOLLC